MKQDGKKSSGFFKDSSGKVVTWQKPNTPLLGWIVCSFAVFLLSDGQLANQVQQLGRLFIFTWAYLEITAGESSFRKTLGAVVMLVTILGIFR